MATVCLYTDSVFKYDKAIGFADVAQNKKANVYTQYRIGSISKMFTAVMMLQLVEEKKISLDAKLSQYFPGIKNSSKITIEQLLNHRSGIENFTNEADYTSYMDKPHTTEQLLAIFEKLPSDFEPGSQFSYSNTNYVLLTFIIEKITKSTYAEQLLRRVCARAMLADTRVGGKINTHRNEAQSYQFASDQWVTASETDLSVAGGAGNIVSTAKDLCLFIAALFDGKLLSARMLEKMKDIRDGYGLGMVKFPFGKKVFYGHTGGIDGFESMLAYNEDDKTAMCITGNGFNYSINEIAIGLLSINYGLPFSVPDFEKKKESVQVSKAPEGIYNNEKMGMKITVFKEKDQLMAQATGQQAFALTEIAALDYKFDAAGIRILFMTNEAGNITQFKLMQGGMNLIFVRD
jgi:D-alanyl-D-alanine carboxypeptidase